MGSSARHSTGRKATATRARKGKSPTARGKPAEPLPDVHAILGRFSDALSILSTATRSMAAAEEREGSVTGAEVGAEIITLEHGVRALRAAYDDMDIALRTVLP